MASLAGAITPPAPRSAAYLAAFEQASRFAAVDDIPIVILGESGTGKTQLARQLHDLSPRARGPFEHVMLTTIEDNLAGSTLFGHVPGAFTDARQTRKGSFASAAGGTLFLDEIGKATRTLQHRLLHAIEYREIRPLGSDRDMKVDARIIVATNISLEALVDTGEFLPDLYARLRMFTVLLPPLRARRADIEPLARYFLARHAAGLGYARPPEICPDLIDAIRRHSWPYNLRDLDQTMKRLMVEAQRAPRLTIDLCRNELAYLRPGHRAVPLTSQEARAALEANGGNASAAARSLGVDRTTLHRALRRKDEPS